MDVYPLFLEPEAVREALEKVLPEKISGTGYNLENFDKWGDFEWDKEKQKGFLKIKWLLDPLADTEFQTYTIMAEYNPYWGVNDPTGANRKTGSHSSAICPRPYR